MLTQAELIERIQIRLAKDPLCGDPAQIAKTVREVAGVISDEDVLAILRKIRHESQGVGILESVLTIDGVTDVLVNGTAGVWFDRGQGLELSSVQFDSETEVRQLATRLAVACGRRLDDAQPYADGRLRRDDGSSIRMHAVLSPPADDGTCISLRVLRQAATNLEELVRLGTINAEIADLCRAIVKARHSFLVVGGTGSGKTTMLSAMLTEVAQDQRIICIEDTAELRPMHPHVLSLVSRNRNVDGAGEISMQMLLKQALRMRPDRIVLGEIRGAEITDLLAALNTGHDGGAGTVHANSLAEVPARMEALGMLGGLDRAALNSQLLASVRVVISLKRTGRGRFVNEIGILQGKREGELEVSTIWSRDGGKTKLWHEYVEKLSC